MAECKDLEIMQQIMREKEKEISAAQQQALDAEGKEMAEEKRFTFDIPAAPSDPLR